MFWAALAAGLLSAGLAAGQEKSPPPPPDDPVSNIAERLKERGIDLSEDQIDRARRVVDDIRSGRGADPNDVRSIFDNVRKQIEARHKKRLQEQLGASDDEWMILEPRIRKVRELARLAGEDGLPPLMMAGSALAAGPGGTMGRGPRLLRSTDPNAPERSDVEKGADALRKALGSAQPEPEAVASALKAYRAARAKARADLKKARQELREVVTVRQEAQLVTMGVLE